MSGNGRNVSGVTLNDFFAAVLRQLGAPVTQNNLSKLGAVAALEGHGGDYNPFNYVTAAPGSTPFNNLSGGGHVQNYANVQQGVDMTARLLSQGNTSGMRSNLMSDGTYSGWIAAASNFYHSWGGPTVIISQPNAISKLNQQIDGPNVTNWSGSGGGVTAPQSNDPNGWGDISRWMDASQNVFTTWLRQQSTDRQQQIVDWLHNNVGNAGALPEVGRLLGDPNTEQPLKSYITDYLAKLPNDQQLAQVGQLGVQGNNGAAAPTPGPSPELTNLLSSLGVSYPNAPQPTPALLAFLTGIGMNLQTASDLKDRAIQRIGATANDAMANIDRTAGRTKQNITADLVRRGVLGSGEANTRYANQAQDVAAQQRDVQRVKAQGTEQAQDVYTQAQANAKQQALDRVISAEQDQQTQAAVSKAQADQLKAQQDAADLANARQTLAETNAYNDQLKLIQTQANQGFSA